MYGEDWLIITGLVDLVDPRVLVKQIFWVLVCRDTLVLNEVDKISEKITIRNSLPVVFLIFISELIS